MKHNRASTDSGRLVGIDLARCMAIIGMIIINFNEALAPSYHGSDWLHAIVGFIPGRAAVTFVVLAGIGMSLMARKARLAADPALQRNIQSILIKRAAILFVSGMLFVPFWYGDILHYYGIFLLAGSLLLFRSSRWLWALLVMMNMGFIALLFMFSYGAGWDWSNLTFTDFWTPKGFLRNLVFNGWFPIFPWFGFILLGLWLGRLDLRNKTVLKRCIVGGGSIMLAAEIVSRGATHWIRSAWPELDWTLAQGLFGRGCLPPGPFFVLSTAGGATCVIAACLYLAEKHRDAAWLQPLIVTGQFAFSIYIGHVLFVIYPLLMLGWTDVPLALSLTASLTACAVFVLISNLWKRGFSRGPLEWLMRRLSNGKPEPTGAG